MDWMIKTHIQRAPHILTAFIRTHNLKFSYNTKNRDRVYICKDCGGYAYLAEDVYNKTTWYNGDIEMTCEAAVMERVLK